MTYEDLFGVHTVTMVTTKWMSEMSVFLFKEHCYIGGTLLQMYIGSIFIENAYSFSCNFTYFLILFFNIKLYQFLIQLIIIVPILIQLIP